MTTRVGARAWWRAAVAVTSIGWAAQQFTPLLLMYQDRFRLPSTTVQAMFGIYIVGLIPGLLLGGPFSDRYGRRRVMIPTLILAIVSTLLSIVGGTGTGWLFVARLVAGIASGAGFSNAAAWIKELSAAGTPDGARHGPRRITIAMGVGFGLGPLVAGAIGQWAPAPTVLPYLPHLVLAGIAVLLVRGTPDVRPIRAQSSLLQHLRIGEARDPRFLGVVVPLAPWVFIPGAIAMAYLPGLVKSSLIEESIIFSAVSVTMTNLAGILVQPLAQWVDRPGRPRLLAFALGGVVAGLLVAAAAAMTSLPAVALVATLFLGAGYGACQVFGLTEVQRLARPDHLASLTAIYQAVSYTGFAAPFVLASAGRLASAGTLLVIVAGLALLTLAWTVLASTYEAQPDSVRVTE